MAPRSGWKGYLKVSLVSIPVKSYTAVNACSSTTISLNQLHAKCNSRIKYVKTCPIHGEVESSEIVSGYEFAKGQYVVIDSDELNTLRTEADRSVNVDSVVPASEVDPLYLGGKTYYLVPDGPVGQKPYALVQKALADEGLVAVATVVLYGKEETVLLRPAEKLIAMTSLNYESEVAQPASFEEELTSAELAAGELKLTKTLLGAFKKKTFDMTEYRDLYAERLQQLIEAKVHGQELVAPPPASDEPQVINLMDALRKSVERVQQDGSKSGRSTASKPTKGAAMKSAARRKRKTG